jgi:putative membrane protein
LSDHATSGADEGTEPDARFTMANERTFLEVPWGRSAIAAPLILLGAVMSTLSYVEWKANQRALRLSAPLPRSQLPKILAFTITVIALLAGALDIYSRVASR